MNLHSSSLEFEPIHRVIFDTDVENLLKSLYDYYDINEDGIGQSFEVITKDINKKLYISNPKSSDGLYEFPTCEYYNKFSKDDCTTRIRITTYRRKSGGKEMYDPSLRLDKIMLIPVLEE
jgi:hypothetical protein